MHKVRYNALHLFLELSPRGPLLVKSGGISADPALPDMQFVRTYQPERGESPYLPGSSLKGVVRGFVEKVLRTLDERSTWRWACATFDDGSCGKKWAASEVPSYQIYRESCGACRLFGHTRLRGRTSFTDFLPVGEVRTETRYGVAISRLSQAVAQGPFEMEVAVAGTFAGQLVLENFELWQLALLALSLESMQRGLLKIGYGKNRGFGEVSVAVQEARLDEVAQGLLADVWRGLGGFVDQSACSDYGLWEPHRLQGLPQAVASENLGLYIRRIYDGEQWRAATAKLLEAVSAV
jgi:CRISPR-associated protein Csm3